MTFQDLREHLKKRHHCGTARAEPPFSSPTNVNKTDVLQFCSPCEGPELQLERFLQLTAELQLDNTPVHDAQTSLQDITVS